MAKKWNAFTRVYEPYDLPTGAVMYSNNLDRLIMCAQCSDVLKYGKGYTSKQIHNNNGLGYCVCERCYVQEWKEEREYVELRRN